MSSSANRSSSRLRRRSQPQDDPPSAASVASNPPAADDDNDSVVEEKEREVKRREPEDQSICPMSQAQMIFHARRSNKNYSVSGRCSLCGQQNAEHPMENDNDSQTLLDALYNPVLRIPRASMASAESKGVFSDSSSSSARNNSNEYQMSKMIRDLSEHHLIKESWNPNNNTLPQLFLRKYETYMSQLAADMPNIWIKLLPSTLHKSIKSEFEWVNREICQKVDITWEAAKKQFIEHWERSDAGLLLLEQYKNLKQPNFQRVNEFINELINE